MDYIKSDYIKGEEKYYKVSLLQLITLVMNVYLAKEIDEIGWQHARETFEKYYMKMNKTFWVERKDIETALWACNMLNEQEKFWHPEKYRLNKFVTGILNRDERFDFYYNFIREDIGERKLKSEKKKKTA